MKCKKCGYEFPDDSEFCPYCGQRVVKGEGMTDHTVNAPIPQHPLTTVTSTAVVPYEAANSAQTMDMAPKMPIKSPSKARAFLHVIPWMLTGAATLCAIILVLKLTELQTNFNTLSSENDSLNSQITTLQNQVTDYKPGADNFKTICDFMACDDAGYASSRFKASQSVFVLKKSAERKSFTLTTNYNRSVTIDLRTSGYSADIEFSKSRWYGSTVTMYVIPRSTGTTVATFSNSVNSQTFRILIIVTE